MKRYTIDLILNTSHSVDSFDYHSSTVYKILDKEEQCKKIVLSIDERNGLPEEGIKRRFEKEAQIASLAVAKNERNPTDGCPYFTLNWASLNIERIPNIITDRDNGMMFEDSLEISDEFSMNIIRYIQMAEINNYLNNVNNYNFLVESFYHGLMSNNDESKFFNFFTIIEHIEKSCEFRKLFKDSLLFNEQEKSIVCNFINHFDDRKKNILAGALGTTMLNRQEKLFQYFSELRLSCISNLQINLDDIRNIIKQRNALFHASGKLNSDILYDKLFPLVRESASLCN